MTKDQKIDLKVFESISKKAYNMADALMREINGHNPSIYSIHYHPHLKSATTFIMTTLRPKTQANESVSTFWKYEHKLNFTIQNY